MYELTISHLFFRRVGLSHSFKEPSNPQHTYKRTVSETPHSRYRDNTLSGQHMVHGGDGWQENKYVVTGFGYVGFVETMMCEKYIYRPE